MWIDISENEKYREEKRGASQKYWIQLKDEKTGKMRTALYKITPTFPNGYSNNTNYGEKIYSEICNKILGVPCAKIELATNGKTEGCLSYNVLEDINQEESDESGRYILIDIASLIQKVRPTFDKSTLKVKNTNEYYSLDLIIEALQEQCKNPDGTFDRETYYNLKKYIVNLCLVDSILGCEDRHALNLSVGRDKKTNKIIPIELYDNGSCLGLWLKPKEVDEILSEDDETPKLRKQITSKVGTPSCSPISFDTLESIIFSHYFYESKELAQKIIDELTPEKVNQILSEPDFDKLDERYKRMIKNEIEFNRFRLNTRFQRGKAKKTIEELLDFSDSIIDDKVIKMALKETLNSNHTHITGKILDEEDIKILKKLHSQDFPDFLLHGNVAITYDTINNATWAILFNKLQYTMPNEYDNLSVKEKKDKIYDYLIENFGFLPDDLDKIKLISETYNMRDLNQDKIRYIMNGLGNNEGIGRQLVDEFLAMQYAKCYVNEIENPNSHAMEYYEKIENYVKDVAEKNQLIADLFENSGIDVSKTYNEIGIKNKDEINDALYYLAHKIQEENIVFESTDSIKEMIVNTAKDTFKESKTLVNGWFINNTEIKKIQDSTKTLQNGEKIAICYNPGDNYTDNCIALGVDYIVRIGEIDNKSIKGKTITFFARQGKEFPPNVTSKLNKIQKDLQEKYGASAKSIVKHVKFPPTKKVSQIFALGTGRNSTFAIKKSEKEIEESVIKLFEGETIDYNFKEQEK